MTWKVRHQRPVVSARARPTQLPEGLPRYLTNAEASLAQPFKGISCFVLGDRLVMTPTFLGSEPVTADSGQHAGIRVFGAEEGKGLGRRRRSGRRSRPSSSPRPSATTSR
jgi:hypothetical protein